MEEDAVEVVEEGVVGEGLNLLDQGGQNSWNIQYFSEKYFHIQIGVGVGREGDIKCKIVKER